MKILRGLFCLTFLLFNTGLQAQNMEWVRSCGGPFSDKGISIGMDSLGYIYISGYYNGQAYFGSDTLWASYNTNKNVFVAKMDSAGNFLWAVDGTGGPFDDRALGMHVDPAGNVYLTGTFWGFIDFGNGITANGNGYDSSLLVKINTNGVAQWARSFGAGTGGPCPWPMYDGDDHSYDAQVDKDGNIYVTGFWSGEDAQFDAFTLSNPDWDSQCQPAGYVGKLDPLGNFLWVRQFDGVEDQRGSRDNRLAIDKDANVYVTGGFEGVGIYGPGTANPLSVTAVNGWDTFLFKMDSNGNFIWVKNVGSDKDDRGNGIAIDQCGDVYICGEYRDPMVFPGANASNGTDTLSHKKKRDVFVAKCTPDGDWVWAKRARSEKRDKPYQMSVDKNNQVFICGEMSDEGKFTDNITIPNPDTNMIAFVAQLDGEDGDWQWARSAGGTADNDRANDVVSDGRGHAYVVGFYEDSAHFDNQTLYSLGKKDIFIWKLSTVIGSVQAENTYDTTSYTYYVCDLDSVQTIHLRDSLAMGCDTVFTDTITDYLLDPNMGTSRFIQQYFETSCHPADTGVFAVSDSVITGCHVDVFDTITYVSLLPSSFDYHAYTVQDSSCNPLDTGLFVTALDTFFVDCDTIVNESFVHVSWVSTVPDCDDGDCQTIDTYDTIQCVCRNEYIYPDSCLNIHLPTAFTPNFDQLNETYKPVIHQAHLLQSYQFSIYNRWGQKIFTSDDPNVGWDGQKAPTGIYSWVLRIVDSNDRQERYLGEVSLIY